MNYDKMKQKQLRPACKAAGIKYGKMNVTQMREALDAKDAVAAALDHVGPAPKAESKPRAGTIVKNGARQPGEGTKCRAVWDSMDDFATKFVPTAQTARKMAEAEGWNVNNTVIEFYQWRKFHGLGKDAS